MLYSSMYSVSKNRNNLGKKKRDRDAVVPYEAKGISDKSIYQRTWEAQ